MLVKALLSSKQKQGIISVQPTDQILAATMVLKKHRIGAVIVEDSTNQIVGILSERDIVRAMALDGLNAVTNTVKAYMTSKVLTCTPDHSVEEIMKQMTINRFRHLPVMADDRLIGVISIGDVVKAKIDMAEREISHMKNYIASG